MLSTDQTVERAFQLARQRHCRNVDEIRRILKAEGFVSVEAHLARAVIKKQLTTLIKAHASSQSAAGEQAPAYP